MMHPLRSIGVATLAGLLVLAAGCSGTKGREPVSGTITFKGHALDQGTIAFEPLDAASGATYEGATVTNGAYDVPAQKGLTPGKYKVRISSPDTSKQAQEEVPGESGPVARERIPAKYNTQSNEVIEVKKGGPNVFDFDIK
jgi:hypothetical protein